MTIFEPALREDVQAILNLLAQDAIGDAPPTDVAAASDVFDGLVRNGDVRIVVGRANGTVAACYQLAYHPDPFLRGTRHALLHAVRVDAAHRGRGIGDAMIRDAEHRARTAGAVRMELTSNAAREDARRFYERLGYTASHRGFRKALD